MTTKQAFMDDQAVIDRILSHVRDGTTDLGHEVWREPVEHYRSEERFAREVALLRRLPVPFCPSAALHNRGDYVTRIAAGVPLLAVRGDDGAVRAFRNACRHRGAEVAKGTGCTRAFVCPFHGWTYGLDGSLERVQHAHGFPEVDPASNGLVPVEAREHGGIVFLTQDPPAREDAPIPALPELIRPEQDLLSANESLSDVNWKISIEGAIEGYHIRFGHPKTFFPYGYDNLNVVETVGRNSRVTYPFRRIEKLADVPAAERKIEGRVTYVYHLFPNALLTVLSRHRILVIFEPVAPGQTRSVSYALAATGGDAAAIEEAKRDASFVNQTGAPEDLALAESVQRNVASDANAFFTFGHFESAIVAFHRNLRAALGE